MTFDIYQLDGLDWDDYEEAFEKYRDSLLEHFLESPEGRSHLEEFPEAGFWAGQLVYNGYGYLGVTLPQMTKNHVEEIVTELFPRKVSLLSPDDADDAIPELTAFWRYLERVYCPKTLTSIWAKQKSSVLWRRDSSSLCSSGGIQHRGGLVHLCVFSNSRRFLGEGYWTMCGMRSHWESDAVEQWVGLSTIPGTTI